MARSGQADGPTRKPREIDLPNRIIIAGAGILLCLLGLAFLLISANAFSTSVFVLGLTLSAGGLWPELRPRLAQAFQLGSRCIVLASTRLAAVLRAWRQAQLDRAAASAWPAIGDYRVEVVGESMYQAPLIAAARGKATGPLGISCKVQLLCEPKNPFDANAVAVLIKRQKVGYLSRADARAFRKRLGETGNPVRTTTCSAIIRGGGVRDDGERMFYGVWLDLEPL